MRKVPLVPTWVGVIAISGLAASCDDPSTKLPTAPSAPLVSRVEISGPASIAPGQSAQFTATIQLSDGTAKLAAGPSVRWLSSDPSVLQLSESGLATAGQLGDAIVTAEVAPPTGGFVRSPAKGVMVLPDGTFRIIGAVSDAEFPTLFVDGARVEATPGPLVATTNENGKYRLYGVPADATLRVTADSYQPYEQSLHLAGHAVQDVQLLPGARPTLAGNYTLALDVTDGCKPTGTIPALAADLRHRRYDAVLTQSGSNLDVTLTESRFRLEGGVGNHFSGTVTGNRATFTVEFPLDYGGYADIVEQLPNNTFLIPLGTVVTTLSPTGMTGQMGPLSYTGYTGIMNLGSGFWASTVTELGICVGSLRFTLTPR